MTTLAEEEPFAAVVQNDRLSVTCSSCFALSGAQKGKAFPRCVKCHVVHYCSRECQQKDWADHKRECRLMQSGAPVVPSEHVRLVARIAFKLGRPDAQDPAFNGRVYEDLMDHREDIEKDPSITLFADRMLLILQSFADKMDIPSRDVMISIIGKINTNSFGILYECHSLGSGLYIGLSAHDHSCNPDAFVYFNGSKIVLRSPNKQKKYSKDITICYAEPLDSKHDRQEKLSRYYFTCTCSVCLDPTSDFLRNSVRSTCCPDSYCLLNPEASVLSCFKCGTPSKITVKEAIAANKDANSTRVIAMGKFMLEGDTPAVLQSFSKAYEKFSKVLSPLNLNLWHLTDAVFTQAKALGNNVIRLKYAPLIRRALKHYLPSGHPTLTSRLMLISEANLFDPKPTREGLEIFDEAFEAALLSHGPTYPGIQMINYMKMAYEMKLVGARG